MEITPGGATRGDWQTKQSDEPYVCVGRMIVFSSVDQPGESELLVGTFESDLHQFCLSCWNHEAVGFLGYLRSRLAFHDFASSYVDLYVFGPGNDSAWSYRPEDRIPITG